MKNTQWADSIGTSASPGDLRGLTGNPLVGTTVVEVKGFRTPGDGVVVYWDPDTRTADDGGMVVVPAGAPRLGC